MSVPRRAGFTALGAVIAFGAVQPAASARANGDPRIEEVTVTLAADGAHDLVWTARKPGDAYVYASTDARDPSRSGRLVARTASSGAHVTGFKTGMLEWSVATGYVEDSFHRSGIYGRIGVLTRH